MAIISKPNPNKPLCIQIKGRRFARLPIKTHLITPSDDLGGLVKQYLEPVVRAGDTVFISEKIIAILQGRALPLSQVAPTKWAHFLSRFVLKRPGGIGLGMPETMQTAIDELGLWRILLAGFLAGLTKPFGLRGVFYLVAGNGARAIDGPTRNTIPPYNDYVVKGPLRANQTAEVISRMIKIPTAIIDANDWGQRILGKSRSFKVDKKLLLSALKDNPLGQCSESTPLGILRPV